MFFFLAIAHHCENEERLHSGDLIFYMDTVGWNTLHHHNFIYCSRENIEKDRWPMWAFKDSGGTTVFFCQNIFPNRHHVPELLPPHPWETGPANPRLNSANTWYGINTCAQFLLTLLLPRVVWNNNLTENTSFWYTMYMLVYVPNVFFMNHVLVFWLFLYTNNTSANIAMFFIIYPQLTGSWPVAMRCDSLTAGRPW